MIARISGKLVQKQDHSLIVNVHGVSYEIVAPAFVLERIDETKDAEGNIPRSSIIISRYGHRPGIPMLIGFISEIEKIFLQFIKVSASR